MSSTIGNTVLALLALIIGVALVRTALQTDSALSRLALACAAMSTLLASYYVFASQSSFAAPGFVPFVIVGLLAGGVMLEVIGLTRRWFRKS